MTAAHNSAKKTRPTPTETDTQQSLYEVRRARLQTLRAEFPTLTAFAKELDMNVGYVRRMMQERRDVQARNITESTARHIESRCGKPEFWLDDDVGRTPVTRELWPFPMVPREVWDSLTPVEKRAVQPAILKLLMGELAMRQRERETG